MRVTDLTLREQAAQLMMPRLGSNMLPPVTVAEDLDRVAALLDRCPVGGLILFNGAWPQTPALLADLQRRSRVPLLVASDIERGVGQQVHGATVFPHAMAFDGADDEALLEQAARVQAREALAAGLHVTFSPVADVNRNPRNPIISTRAFASDPERAARWVRAFTRGTRAEGLLTTAKHFPGHGDTSQDSHAELPLVDDPRDVLEATDLLPFRAAVDAGVELVMTAHVRYPALDPDHPATLSRPILHGLLRDDMGFDGAVITDSLLMGAIKASHPDPGAQAVALVEAGVDILLDVADPEAAVDGLVAAVEAGRLPAARLAEACGRVLALKQQLLDRFGDGFFTDPAAAVPPGEVATEETRALAAEVARRAVRVLDARPDALPLPDDAGQEGGLLAVLVKPHRSRFDPPEAPLAAALREAYPGVAFHDVGPETTEETLTGLREAAREAAHVLVAMVLRPAAWHTFGLTRAQQAFVEALLAERPVVLASLGSPYVLDDYPEAAARLCTFSDVPDAQRALVAALGTAPAGEAS